MANEKKRRRIMVIGHRNPDTDSICSAIAYAELKNKISDRTEVRYEPRRAGEINQETSYVLDRFNMPVPKLCTDVRAQVRDLDIREVPGVDESMTMRRAWETMRDQDITSLPITRADNTLAGLVTLQDIAMANMDSLDPRTVANASTSLANILETLKGELITGDPEYRLKSGKVVIGAGSPDVLETSMEKGDIVLLANRYDTQLCAIEMEASCIVICEAPDVAKTIVKLANMNNCAIITTPFDTYTASYLINQSVPIEHIMQTNLRTFSLSTTVEEAKKLMSSVRYNYFPVLDKDNRYRGVISKRNLLNLKRRQLILVDHNEKTQCVDGYEDAEILEIIDHHRIGTLETGSPVYFRNQPVGCTSTIIYQLYNENGIEIEPNIAGIMCCAIMSDTLAFRSPTCTRQDEIAALALAKIAGIDAQDEAAKMFEAGEHIADKSAEEIFLQDYKVFVHNDIQFGVGQGSYVSSEGRKTAKKLLMPYLKDLMRREHIDMVFYMLTSVLENSTDVIWAGYDAESVLHRAFGVEPTDGYVTLDGVVSRKKQFIPAVIRAFESGEDE